MLSAHPEKYVVVVGAANLDILGFSDHELIAGDSNPGRVTLCSGGVGRNIADNLSRLGLKTELITALGTDLNGSFIRDSCIEAGIGMGHSLMLPDTRSSTYIALMNDNRDMALALSDLSIISHITRDYLQTKRELLSSASVIVADTNLSVEALNYLLTEFSDADICVDPVSTTKARKIIPLVGMIHTLKMNAIEAAAISGLPTKTDDDIMGCGDFLFRKGVKRIFITLGNRGVYCRSGDGDSFYIPPPVSVVNTTGAGDAFMAGIVFSTLDLYGAEKTLQFASAVAGLTLSDESTVNPRMSLDQIQRFTREKSADC